MNKSRKQHFRKILDNLALRLQGDTDAVSEEALRSTGGQAAGEITNAPQHLGDMGTDEYLHGINTTLLENEEYIAREVREALSRLDDRTFGICEACGQPIREERLEAIPYTRYCTTCAERIEPVFMANYNSDRPATPTDARAYRREPTASPPERPPFPDEDDQDSHAVGTPGGGTAIGGLAGTTEGRGDPDHPALENAMGSSDFDAEEDRPAKPNTQEVLS